MKLKDLNKATAQEADVKKTDEYLELIHSNSTTVAYVACVLCLRGDFATAAAAVKQAAVQVTVADVAKRELYDTDTTMIWRPSGPSGPVTSNGFIKFIRAQGNINFRSGNTVMNCWEAVICAAILAGVITNPAALEETYGGGDEKFTGKLVNSFISAVGHDYAASPGVAHLPLKGDVVLFDGLSHVALATGEGFYGPQMPPLFPGRRVISFWPAPALMDFGPDTPATVAHTTIETLNEWSKAKYGNGMKVTFGAPDWSALNG